MTPSPRLKGILKGSIVLVCIGLIIYYFKTHTEEIEQIKHIGLKDILAITCTLFFVQALHCYKVFLLINPFGLKGVNFIQWFKILTVSRFVNQHMFQGGNLYRFTKLKKDYQFSYSNSLGLIIYYLWLETVMLLSSAAIIIGLSMLFIPYDFYTILLYLVFIIAGVFVSPFILIYLYRSVGLGKNTRFDEKIVEMSDAIFKHLKDVGFLIKYFAATFLFIFVYMITVKLGFKAVGVELTFSQNVLFTIGLILSRMFNIVPANIGISELICGTISRTIDVTFGSGIIISGIVRIINYMIYGLVTLFVYIQSLIVGDKKEVSD